MTNTWLSVKWSEPAQVLKLVGKDPGDSAGHTVDGYYRMLVEARRYNEAVDYIAQALPRYQAVVWAGRTLNDLADPDAPRPPALKAVLLWMQDPTDARRRAAFEAANQEGVGDAEKLAAFSVFFSGGSISPEGQPPVAAPPAVAGRFAAAAVKVGVHDGADFEGRYKLALRHGEALAGERVEAGE
jgi:hypothetical protein